MFRNEYVLLRLSSSLDVANQLFCLSSSRFSASKVLAERRLNVLRELASQCYSATSQLEFFQSVANSLAQNQHDLPFAIIYNSEVSHGEFFSPLPPSHRPLVGVISASTSRSDLYFSFPVPHSSSTTPNEPDLRSTLNFSLVSSVGLPMHHPSAPSSLLLTMDLNSKGIDVATPDGFPACPWPISEAVLTREPVFVKGCRGLVEGFDTRTWENEMPDTALVIPSEFRKSSRTPPSLSFQC